MLTRAAKVNQIKDRVEDKDEGKYYIGRKKELIEKYEAEQAKKRAAMVEAAKSTSPSRAMVERPLPLPLAYDIFCRCDTIHDFSKSRSVLTLSHVLELLNNETKTKKEDLLKNLQTTFKQAGLNLNETAIEKHLKIVFDGSSCALVYKDTPFRISPKTLQRINELSSYEPSVVAFYEMYQDTLAPNIGNLITFDEEVHFRYGFAPDVSFARDITTAIGEFIHVFSVDGGASITNPEVESFEEQISRIVSDQNMIIFNLGVTRSDRDETREPTRMYSDEKEPLTKSQYKEIRINRTKALTRVIQQCFGGNIETVVNLIIDTSLVSFKEDLDITFTDCKIRVLNNVASEWDGATKISVGVTPDKFKPILESIKDEKNIETNPASSLVFLNSLELKAPNYVDIGEGKGKEIMDTYSRKVNELSEQIYNQEDPAHKYFDLKRTGDGLQVQMAANLHKLRTPYDIFVFVTIDHLAFLKARMLGVPSIFTRIDSVTDERVMVMYRPDDMIHFDPVEALKKQIALEQGKCQLLIDNYTSAETLYTRYLGDVLELIDTDLPIGQQLEIKQIMELWQKFIFMKDPSKYFAIDQVDEIFNLIKKPVNIGNTIANLEKYMTKLEMDDRLTHLKDMICLGVMFTLCIESYYNAVKMSKFFASNTEMMTDRISLQRLLMSSASSRDTLLRLNEFYEKYSFVDKVMKWPEDPIQFLVEDMSPYVNIVKKIKSLIGTELYRKSSTYKLGPANILSSLKEKVFGLDEYFVKGADGKTPASINTFTDAASATERSIGKMDQISQRLKIEFESRIIEKVKDILKSFMKQQMATLNFTDVSEETVTRDRIEALVNKNYSMRGGGGDENEDGFPGRGELIGAPGSGELIGAPGSQDSFPSAPASPTGNTPPSYPPPDQPVTGNLLVVKDNKEVKVLDDMGDDEMFVKVLRYEEDPDGDVVNYNDTPEGSSTAIKVKENEVIDQDTCLLAKLLNFQPKPIVKYTKEQGPLELFVPDYAVPGYVVPDYDRAYADLLNETDYEEYLMQYFLSSSEGMLKYLRINCELIGGPPPLPNLGSLAIGGGKSIRWTLKQYHEKYFPAYVDMYYQKNRK